MDPQAVGRRVKEMFPHYSRYSDEQIGLLYINKYGGTEQKNQALGLNQPIPQEYTPPTSTPISTPTPTLTPEQQEQFNLLTTPQQIPTQQPQKQGSFFSNLLSALISPFVNTGKMIGEAGYQGYLTALPGGPQDIGSREQQARLQKPSLFMNEDELSRSNIIRQAAQNTAGLASYAVPFGATSAFGRAIPAVSKGYGGIAAGGLFRASQPDATPENIATSAGLGGIGARLLPSIFGVGKGLQQTGQGIKQGIINPQAGRGAGAITREQELTKQLTDLGIVKGSAQATRQASADLYGQTSKEIGNILQASTKGQGISRLKNAIKTYVTERGSYYVPGDKTYSRLLDREIKLVSRNVEPSGKVLAPGIDKAIRNLDDQLANAYRKETGELQSAITAPEGVRLDVRRSLDEILTAIEPGVKQLKGTLATLQKAAPGLAESAGREESLRPLGIPTGINLNTPLQFLKNQIAGGLQTAGRITEPLNIGTPALQSLLGGILPGGLSAQPGGGSVDQISQIAPQTKEDLLTKYGLTGGQTTEGQWPQGFVTPQQYSQGVLDPSLTKEQKDQLKESYSAGQTIHKESLKKGTGEEFLDKALQNIDVTLALPDVGHGPLKGGLAAISLKIGGVGVPESMVKLNERYALLRLNILRAYQGARISDADYELAGRYTPNIWDAPKVARAKLETLKEILSGAEASQQKQPNE